MLWKKTWFTEEEEFSQETDTVVTTGGVNRPLYFLDLIKTVLKNQILCRLTQTQH